MGRKRTGQIKELGENRFYLKIETRKKYKARGHFGETFEGTREEADAYLKECLKKLAEIEKNPIKATTVSQLFRIFIDRKKKLEVSEKTLEEYEDNLRLNINPYIGDILIIDFKAKDGRDFIETMNIERGLALETIRKDFLQLRAAFDYALEKEWVDRNPLHAVKAPKGGTVNERKIPTVEEIQNLFAGCKSSYQKALWMTAYFTGMRPEEYLALRWSDIDYVKGHFKIERVIVELKKQRPIFKPTKTKKSKRLQPMNAQVAEALKKWRIDWLELKISRGSKWGNLDGEKDLIFPTMEGNICLNSNLNRQFKKALQVINGHDPWTIWLEKEKARREKREFIEPKSKNLIKENISPYSLRHAFATHLLDAGATLKDVSDLLGHSSIRVTADTYLHISEERKSTQVDKLQDLIFAKAG